MNLLEKKAKNKKGTTHMYQKRMRLPLFVLKWKDLYDPLFGEKSKVEKSICTLYWHCKKNLQIHLHRLSLKDMQESNNHSYLQEWKLRDVRGTCFLPYTCTLWMWFLVCVICLQKRAAYITGLLEYIRVAYIMEFSVILKWWKKWWVIDWQETMLDE